MADSLVATKLLPPWAHRPVAARPQLVARLRAGLEGPLTLLCAPAGFGKSSLVLQALDGYAAATAWLSLEPDDGEPTRFAHYLLAAIARATPDLAPALDPMQRSSPLDLLATMATLVNLLSARDTPLVLVLEDYHTMDAPAVDGALGWLLAHPPPALRLLITSREDPPLPLARLRARGQLAELRGADLRFSSNEAVTLITHLTGLALSDHQVDALVSRTEGWAAGIHLASLALRESADIDGLIASLRGTHRLLFDYLTDEVLLAQPLEIQQFLLQTSILDRLCGELCDAVVKDEGRRMKDEVQTASSDHAEPFILHPSSLRSLSAPTSSSSRSTRSGAGIATTRCLPTCCAPGSSPRRAPRSPRCIGGRRAGTLRRSPPTARRCWTRPSTTPWRVGTTRWPPI